MQRYMKDPKIQAGHTHVHKYSSINYCMVHIILSLHDQHKIAFSYYRTRLGGACAHKTHPKKLFRSRTPVGTDTGGGRADCDPKRFKRCHCIIRFRQHSLSR